MTQVAIVLVIHVAMVFTGLSIQIARFHSQSGGGLMRETKIPMQELWLKMGGGLVCEGGILAGFYGIIKSTRNVM